MCVGSGGGGGKAFNLYVLLSKMPLLISKYLDLQCVLKIKQQSHMSV